MEITLTLIPLLISLDLGFLAIERIFPKGRLPGTIFLIFLSAGLGLGLSSELIFYSMVILDKFDRLAALGVHAVVLGAFFNRHLYSQKRPLNALTSRIAPVPGTDGAAVALIFLLTIPLFVYAQFYPFGGWDAWQVWNFKSKFIFLAGDQWKNMLTPDLWRTSPHYPLLLPLINVWGWALLKTPLPLIGLLTAVLFTFLTSGVLFGGLKELTGKLYSLLPALVLLTLPFYLKLSSSQYCDIVTAFYLLSGVIALTLSHTHGSAGWAFLAGMFLGLLGFTKNEGSLAVVIVAVVAVPYLIHAQRVHKLQKNIVLPLIAGCALTFIPVILFELLYSPGNQTFVNGLTSRTLPSEISRLQLALMFLWVELTHAHWSGFWGVIVAGIILSKGNCFRRRALLTPLFLLCYLGIIIVYYYINTYFKITWWLQVTLHRVIFSLVPIALFWVCYGVWGETKSKCQKVTRSNDGAPAG